MSRPDDAICLDWQLIGEPAAERCASLGVEISRYAHSPGGRWLTPDQLKDIQHALGQVAKRLKDSKPARKCPVWPNCKRGCKPCDGAGFLPERMKGVMK